MRVTHQTIEQTPLDQLRSLLDKVDARIGALETSSTADAVNLLKMLDQIDVLHADLAAAGVDLRAEETRLETIRLTLQRKAGTLLRLVKPQGGLAGLRERRKVNAGAWWGQLDAYVAEKRRREVRSFLTGVVVLAAILIVAAFVYQRFFAPDPQVIARLNYMQKAQTSAQEGKYQEALQSIDAGLAEFPDDGEMLLWQGAILVQLKRQQEAQVAFAAARPTFEDEPSYLIQRSTIRLQAGDFDGGLADSQEAVRIAPDNAQAYLVLGGAYEIRGQATPAIQAYQKSAELAAASKNSQLEAVAKVRLAMLMQSAPMFQPSPQPTP
jgi:Flp pilus assembly protein TadD